MFRDLLFALELVVIRWANSKWDPRIAKKGVRDERPQHRVAIGRRFAIGRYPVTFDEYDRFCEAKQRKKPGGGGWGRGRRPVIDVSWNDARDYVAWLSQETGQAYRLPSEAGWEYACRAGTTSRYSFGDAITARDVNYADSGLGRTSEITAYPANRWGLYDIDGNVWEWVEDDGTNYQAPPTDGSPWKDAGTSPDTRLCLLRGGSWHILSRYCRSAYRMRSRIGIRYSGVGFRVARTLS